MRLATRCFELADYRNARELWQARPGIGLSQADEEQKIHQLFNVT